MNWVAIGTVKGEFGYNDLHLSRDGMEATISFKKGNVHLVKPHHPHPFMDFVELERWLATSDDEAENDEEILYYRALEKYITDMGFYEPLLELQGTDEEYCIATLKLHKAGYLSGQPEKVIGALTMDSVKKYQANRALAILFLESLEKKLLNNPSNSAKQMPSGAA